MIKINFKDLPDTTTPLNANNLNTMQDNIEDAIDNIEITLDSAVSTSSTNGVENQAITNYVDSIASSIPEVKTTQTTSDSDTYSCTYINNLKSGILLWTNEDTTQSISTKNITLSSSDYDILQIFYQQSTSDTRCYSQSFLKETSGRIFLLYSGNFIYRNIDRTSDTAYTIGASSDSSANNIIPVKIIGYKM